VLRHASAGAGVASLRVVAEVPAARAQVLRSEMRLDDEAPAERVFIGLGANLGQPRASLEAAIAALGQLPGTRLVGQSACYASAPIDAQGPEFINAVAELRTSLEPAALLQALHAIEAEHGRLRPYRNAPRTLDLDLLMFGQRQLDSPTLVLPHPRMHQRAFVLLPLLELAPDAIHPALGPLAASAAATADQTIRRLAP
jgi:2-amino-4-hydroxy-6-hydroxymethyldihydropteridine diphosphokinase